jgi:AbrB family looped-hinge helix DNA binding protein
METGEYLMALVRVKQNFQITLPVDVRNALGISQGDLLEATVYDNAIVLTPKTVIDRTEDVTRNAPQKELGDG